MSPLLCKGMGNSRPLPYRSSELSLPVREGEADVGFFDISAEHDVAYQLILRRTRQSYHQQVVHHIQGMTKEC